MSDKLYKAKHHVATGQFSYVEIEVEAPMETIVAQGHWLERQFKSNEK